MHPRRQPQAICRLTASQLDGQWTLRFDQDGTLLVTAPTSYGGVISGVSWSAARGVLTTDLFVEDVCSNLPLGRYSWTTNAQSLTMAKIEDPCSARVLFLSGQTWLRTG
jgi:hypothetical protein